MSTYLATWLFSRSGKEITPEKKIEFQQHYEFFSVLSDYGTGASGLATTVVSPDQTFTDRDHLWLRDPDAPQIYSDYEHRIKTVYGPPHPVETCVYAGGLECEVFACDGTLIRWMTLDDLFQYNWLQHCFDRDGERTTAAEIAGDHMFETLNRLRDLGVYYILFSYH